MPAVEEAVRLEGFKELQRAFKRADATLSHELRGALVAAAEPVRVSAEQKASTQISHILSPTAVIDWWQMRVGVTSSSVYVAPRQHGTINPSRKRPNLAILLLGRAMEPALREHRSEVIAEIDHMLGTVGQAWESV